jgi:ketosteroid isomerase-like protein
MSRENIELVRRGYEAFAQGDVEAALAMFDPHIRIEDHDRSLETPTTYEGREAS